MSHLCFVVGILKIIRPAAVEGAILEMPKEGSLVGIKGDVEGGDVPGRA